MLRPRWKTRTWMLLMVVLAVALGLAIPAFRIGLDQESHLHTRTIISPDGRALFVLAYFTWDPFWPRYWQYLRGRPWKRQPLCGPGDVATYEACELEHPEIAERQPDGQVANFGLSPNQRAEYERRKGLDPSTQAYSPDRRPIP